MSEEYAEHVALFARPHGRYGSQRAQQPQQKGKGSPKSQHKSQPRSQPTDPVKAHQEHWRAAGRADQLDDEEDDDEYDQEEAQDEDEEVDTTLYQRDSLTQDASSPKPSPGKSSNIKPPPTEQTSLSLPSGGSEDDKTNLFDEVLGTVHEKAMVATGFGKLQWTLFIVLGLGIMGDGIELLVIAYILPGAERELCMDDQMKGWLGAIAFAGMMVGATLWGTLSDKIGRRPTLITALGINAVFSILTAFVPAYWMLLLCRLISGVGIGGSIPVVFAYFAEFCPLVGRGQKLGFLLMFWVFGGIYVSGLGWVIIPHKDIQLAFSEGYVFTSWRIFLLVCTLPIIISVFGLFFMPESPRFLLQTGRDLDALAVYRQVYLWNHTEAGAEYEMPEIEIPARAPIRQSEDSEPGGITGCIRALENFWNSIFTLFFPPLTKQTSLLCITWFSIAFGYYGLTIWFPEYMKKLEMENYFSQRNEIYNSHLRDLTYTGLLDNLYYYNSTFHNVTFKDILMRHVTFKASLLENCNFVNVTARKSYFEDTQINDCVFNDTNFYNFKFERTDLENVRFGEMKEGCPLDFDTSYSTETVFLENFVGQLAVIPGTLITALLVDKIGRVKMLASSLFLAGVSVFFIWFTNTEIAVVVINCIFNLLVVGAWNSLDMLSTELYPTQLRTTAFGFLSCLGRIAAILGNVAFGNFLAVSKAIPILLTSAIMAMGGFLAIKLPESKNRLM